MGAGGGIQTEKRTALKKGQMKEPTKEIVTEKNNIV